MQYLYLHGFASSPQSIKGCYFRQKFAELGLELRCLDLNVGDFASITVSKMLAYVEQEINQQPTTLIGSSLGGLLSLILATRHPDLIKRLILLAPALELRELWPDIIGADNLARWMKTGQLDFYHSGSAANLALKYNFVTDFASFEDHHFSLLAPTLIFHGRRDATIPCRVSEEFAQQQTQVTLQLLDCEHGMEDVLELIWPQCKKVLFEEG